MVQNCGPVVYNPHLILSHQQGHSEHESTKTRSALLVTNDEVLRRENQMSANVFFAVCINCDLKLSRYGDGS